MKETIEYKQTLEEYAEFVASLANNNNGTVFYNTGKDHASIVMSNIFYNSNDTIRMLSGNLKGDICGSDTYLLGLFSFLRKEKSKIQIMLEEFDKNVININIFNALKYYKRVYPSKVIIKKTNSIFIDDDNKEKVHFLVGDTSKYRIEYNTKNYLARCSFNNPKDSEYLINIFDDEFVKCEEIPFN